MEGKKTLFEKIIAREIPAKIEYEDELCIAIHDVNPQAPTHLLIIPKRPIIRVSEAIDKDRETLGHLILIGRNLVKKCQLEKGFRLVINNGSYGGETIPHLHIHLLGGRQLNWPPG